MDIKNIKEMIILLCCLVIEVVSAVNGSNFIEVVDAVNGQVKERHKLTNEDLLACVFFAIVVVALLLGIIGAIIQGKNMHFFCTS